MKKCAHFLLLILLTTASLAQVQAARYYKKFSSVKQSSKEKTILRILRLIYSACSNFDGNNKFSKYVSAQYQPKYDRKQNIPNLYSTCEECWNKLNINIKFILAAKIINQIALKQNINVLLKKLPNQKTTSYLLSACKTINKQSFPLACPLFSNPKNFEQRMDINQQLEWALQILKKQKLE